MEKRTHNKRNKSKWLRNATCIFIAICMLMNATVCYAAQDLDGKDNSYPQESIMTETESEIPYTSISEETVPIPENEDEPENEAAESPDDSIINNVLPEEISDSPADNMGITDESTTEREFLSDTPVSEDAINDMQDTSSEENVGAMECPIPAGLYFIADTDHQAMVSISGNSSTEHANIQMGAFINSNARIFNIVHTQDGKCTIQSIHTGLYISSDALGNVEQVKTPVPWSVQKTDDAYILTDAQGRYLFAGSTIQGSNISTGQTSAGWDFIPTKKRIAGKMVSLTCPEEIIRDKGRVDCPEVKIVIYGYTLQKGKDYTISFKDWGSTAELVMNGIGDYQGTVTRKLAIYEYAFNEGTYRMNVTGIPQLQLAIKGNASAEGTEIILYKAGVTNARIFTVSRAEQGCYTICSLHTGKYLVPENAKDGARVLLKKRTSSPMFLWRIEKKGSAYTIKNHSTGAYLHANGIISSKVTARSTSCSWDMLTTKPYMRGSMVGYTYKKTAAFLSAVKAFEEPAVTISLYGRTLKQGTDFKAEYTADVEKMKGTVTLWGTGGYQGKTSLSYDLTYDRSKVKMPTVCKGLAGQTYYIRPEGTGTAVALTVPNVANGVQLKETDETGEKFLFSYLDDGSFKIVSHNINFSLYGGSQGRSPLTMHQTNTKDESQRWLVGTNPDGSYAVVNMKSGFALTRQDGRLVLYPYCGSDSQKFVLEPVTTAWENRQTLNYKLNTYNSEGTYIWTFVPATNDTVVYFTKEGTHHKEVMISSGVRLDMKNRTFSILKGFRYYEKDLPALKTIYPSNYGISLKAGQQYRITLDKYDTFCYKADLCEVSTGRHASMSVKYDAGRGWGTIRTHVYGSLSSSNMRAYTTGEGDLLGIVGDSYTEAASLGENYRQGYLGLTEKELGIKVAASSRGGAKSEEGVEWLQNYYLDAYHPKYLVLEFGMNDTDYNYWLSNTRKMISLCEAYGITPILMTVPPVTNSQSRSELHRKMSQWVKTSGYAYLDFERFMTKNEDRITPDEGRFLKDGTHPTVKVHELIAKQLVGLVR